MKFINYLKVISVYDAAPFLSETYMKKIKYFWISLKRTDINNLLAEEWFIAVIILLVIWSAVWKGIALWKSARNKQPIWFIVLLLVNTIGILEIIYLKRFQKK